MNEAGSFVILCPGFAASEHDSTCLPMQQHLVRTINKLYPDLHIVILSFQYPYHQQAYRWFNNIVFSFNGRNRGSLHRLILRKRIHSVLRQLHSRAPIGGLLSFWYGECAAVGKQFGKQYGIPHYCWILGQDARKENKYPKKIPMNGNELIALSEFLQAEFEKNHGIKPFMVIPPGIDPVEISTREREIDILGAGSLIPLKRYDIFLETVAWLKTRRPSIKAVLIGEGTEKEKLENMITTLGLKEQVELTGRLEHHEVLEKMQKAKILLHPSEYEGFSGVCQEALAAGSHVISFTKPMKDEIPHWYIVTTKDEMNEKSLHLLEESKPGNEPVIPFTMQETAKKFMRLFGVT
jgi:glycosyltransferase involved in cell wall biosynthesis